MVLTALVLGYRGGMLVPFVRAPLTQAMVSILGTHPVNFQLTHFLHLHVRVVMWVDCDVKMGGAETCISPACADKDSHV